MGLIIKLKKNQRLYFGDITIETDYKKGQIVMFITGPNPFPYRFLREDLEEYRNRVFSPKEGGENEERFCNMFAICEPTIAGQGS